MNTNRSTIACKELWINSASVGLRPDAEILLKPNDSYLLAHPNTELSQLTPSTAKAYLYTVIEVSDAKAFKSLGLVRGRVAHIKALSVDGTGLVGHFIITGIWLPENESDFPYAVSLHATTDSVHGCWEMVGTATDKEGTDRYNVACKELWIDEVPVAFLPGTYMIPPTRDNDTVHMHIRIRAAETLKSLGMGIEKAVHIKALSVDGKMVKGYFNILHMESQNNPLDDTRVVTLKVAPNFGKLSCSNEPVELLTEEDLTINIRKLAKEMETLESTIEVKDYSAKIELARNFDDLHLCVTSNRDPAEKVERFILPTEVSGRIRELESYTGVLKEALHRYGNAYPKFEGLKYVRDALVAKRYVLRTKEDVSIAQQELREAERIFERALAQQRKAKEKANEKDSV